RSPAGWTGPPRTSCWRSSTSALRRAGHSSAPVRCSRSIGGGCGAGRPAATSASSMTAARAVTRRPQYGAFWLLTTSVCRRRGVAAHSTGRALPLRCTFLHEGLRAFGHVVRADGLRQHPHALEIGVADRVPPYVGGDLRDLEVTRAHQRELPCPSPRLLLELVVGYHGVDPAHGQRVARGIPPAEERDLLGALLAHGHGQHVRSSQNRRAADSRTGLTEPSALGGDRDVARDHELVAAAGRRSVDRGD